MIFRGAEALNPPKSKTILVAHQVYYNGTELVGTQDNDLPNEVLSLTTHLSNSKLFWSLYYSPGVSQ